MIFHDLISVQPESDVFSKSKGSPLNKTFILSALLSVLNAYGVKRHLFSR